MGYSTEMYSEAKIALERQRIANEQALEKRRRILFQRSPRAEQIEYEIARTSVAAARAVFSGNDLRTTLQQLKSKNLKLQAELDYIIQSLGLPKNYLEMWYQCPKCKDYGYANDRMCTCMKALLRNMEYQKLNESSPLSLSDFDSFSLDYYSKAVPAAAQESDYEHMRKILSYCRKYAAQFSKNSDSLLFQGGPGNGKTHLSLAIAKEVIDKGYGVVYVSAPSVLKKIDEERFRAGESQTERTLTECDLLILDDLGTEAPTKFTVSDVYNLINTRMLTSKPMIISTNLSSSDLQQVYDIRVMSRIIGTLSPILFVETDVRQKKMFEKHPPKDENGE